MRGTEFDVGEERRRVRRPLSVGDAAVTPNF